MRARRCVAVALALLAALALAACGGGGETDRTPGLSPAQILERARAEAAALTSYRVGLTADLQVTAAPGALPPAAQSLLGDRLELNGQATLRRPDALSLDFAVAGLPFQGNLTAVEGKLYLSVLGNDLQLLVPPEQLAQIRPAEFAPTLLSWIVNPREVGRESIDGAPTVHLEGALDAGAVVDDVAGLLRQFPGVVGGTPSPAELARARRQIRAALRRGTADVWVGTGDLRPHRVRIGIALAGRLDVLPQVSAASLDLVADLSRFDEPVEIAAPSNPRPVTPDALLRLIGAA
ncbi:MAG: hypothetical protein QOK40_2465 [Miltoncostaeaceae bacterium]|jgi:hypothetical protein|nr:hypothetical protein [Miltoncostaeaceae bacterium]